MPKPLKYPELANLRVGQSLVISDPDVNLPALRVSVGEYARRNGIKLTVHKNGTEIEVARRAQNQADALDAYITATLHSRGLGEELHDEVKLLVEAAIEAL